MRTEILEAMMKCELPVIYESNFVFQLHIHTMILDWILKNLKKVIVLLWGLLIGVPLALLWEWLPRQLENTTMAKSFLLLLALTLLIAAYALAGLWKIYSTNPRRGLQYTEKGHFWTDRMGIKYCGHCMNEGHRREIKYNEKTIWECTNCNRTFSPHEIKPQ